MLSLAYDQGSSMPEEHALYVWDNFLESSRVKHIGIVAHSYGGFIAMYLVSETSSRARETREPIIIMRLQIIVACADTDIRRKAVFRAAQSYFTASFGSHY